jgi:hypothetical protein
LATFADYGAAVYDVRMVQGDDFIEPITLEDGEGEAMSLAGYTFRSQLRRTPDGPVVAEFGISVAGNIVTRTIAASVTAGFDGEYVHDFQWTDPQGNIRTLFAGRFEVEPEVTR